MDGCVDTKDEFNQLVLEGDTKPNTDTCSTPGDPVVWSPMKDPILKYSKDPPALIACVTYPDAISEVANLVSQCDGCYRKREVNGRGTTCLIGFHKL